MNSKHSWQNYGLKHIAGGIGERFLSNQNEFCQSEACRIKGSSGFEHVFLGEKKNDKVQGFHNWLYFYYMEEKNKVLKQLQLDWGSIRSSPRDGLGTPYW